MLHPMCMEDVLFCEVNPKILSAALSFHCSVGTESCEFPRSVSFVTEEFGLVSIKNRLADVEHEQLIFCCGYQHGVLLSRIMTHRIDWEPSQLAALWHVQGCNTRTAPWPCNLLEHRAYAH